jgi:NhaP-type Na+/H+ or K+/H+ antiporter
MTDGKRDVSPSSALARVTTRSKRQPGSKWRPVLFWAIFLSGLSVEALAPHLKIEHNAFVIPPSLVSQGKEINLAALVMRERRVQLLAGLLTLGGAIGLGLHYRDSLIGRNSQQE